MVDIVDLKREIEEILGDNGPEYFRMLRLLFSNRIEKDKFVSFVNEIFPATEIRVHNRFINFIQGNNIETDPKISDKYKGRIEYTRL